MVGVPVDVHLTPAPTEEFATIDVDVPDLGDGDPGETLHVVWVVSAAPAVVEWHWPDATASNLARWIPQTYEEAGAISAVVVYQVTASGFWSDGLSIHALPSLVVGTMTVPAALPYSVEQLQPALG
ncbi:MAG: hypothetical protein ACREOD_10250 [Candidatus Dormibacteria bacterium]